VTWAVSCQAGNRLPEHDAGGMVYFGDKTIHDIVKECHLLAVKVAGAGYKQIRYLAQDFGPRANVFCESDASNSSISDWWRAELFCSVEFRFRRSSKTSGSGFALGGIFDLGDVEGAGEVYFA
jgi:hypothetical protein